MLDLEYKAGAIVVAICGVPWGVLTAELLDSLQAAIAYIGPEHAIVLTGIGGVFAPDLASGPGPVRAEALNLVPRTLEVFRAHPRPVVAAVNGDAVGAGYELACAADFRIMSAGVVQPSSRSAVCYQPAAAVAAGLVDRCCDSAELIDMALRQVSRIDTRAAVAG
ncbi:enoyl-CoA hydratase/isomerase family protein [Saccharopolyspora sp. NPDC002376]